MCGIDAVYNQNWIILPLSYLHNRANPDTKQTNLTRHEKKPKKKGKNELRIFFASIDFPKKEETKETKGKKGKNELQISSLHNSANPDTKQTYLAMHASINFQKKEKQKVKNKLQIFHNDKKQKKKRIKPMPWCKKNKK